MNSILSHLKWKGVVSYIDDVLIGGETLEHHLKLFERVLAAVKEFTISPKKCEVAVSKIKFSGYITSEPALDRTLPKSWLSKNSKSQ